jgi:hypothetical protein
MEAALGISLYSYLHLKLAKTHLIISYVFSSRKSENKRAEQVQPRKRGVSGRKGEVAQTMYTHISKCKNDKIKERKKNAKTKIM